MLFLLGSKIIRHKMLTWNSNSIALISFTREALILQMDGEENVELVLAA